MQVISITRYCDVHIVFHGAETRVEVTEADTRPYNLGEGEKLIEICGSCRADITLSQLTRVLDERGVEGGHARREAPQPRKKKNHPGPRQDQILSCEFCSTHAPLRSVQAKGMHEFRKHPWQRLLWEKENGFKTNAAGKHHRDRRLRQLDRIGISLEDAAAREKALGDDVPTNSDVDETAFAISGGFEIPKPGPMINGSTPVTTQ